MLYGAYHFVLSQSAENTLSELTWHFMGAAFFFIGGFLLLAKMGPTDEEFTQFFDRFATWLERPKKYPPLPWGRTIAKLCLAVIPTLWVINWHGTAAAIMAVVATSIFAWAIVPFGKALWHRAELMDKEEYRRNYPDLPWP